MDSFFAKDKKAGHKPRLVLTRALTREKENFPKIPASRTAEAFAFQPVGDGGAVAGSLDLTVKPGKAREAKRLLEEGKLRWHISDDASPWYWQAVVPNFSEGFWAKKLYDSGLFDFVGREQAEAGPGDEIMFYCQTKRVFSVDPWRDFAQAQLESRAFFKKIVTGAFGGKPDVTIDWLAVSKQHTYRAIIRGPSATIGRGAAGLWEEHQFEVAFSDSQPFQPPEGKTAGRKEYIVVSVMQITCKTAHGPAGEPPPTTRYSTDESQESILFLRKFGDSLMEQEKAIVDPAGFGGLLFDSKNPAKTPQ